MVESMGEKKAIRAAIYARVSTAAQDPEPQLAALREYVKQRGFVLHKEEYVDRVTGDFSKRKKKRARTWHTRNSWRMWTNALSIA